VKRILLIYAFVVLSATLSAQYAEDALRFSQVYWQGTARNMATGSAFSVMGGDFSALSINPGGIGVYRAKYFSATPEVFTNKINSQYNGSATEDSKTMFDMSNFGYILTKKMGKGASGWKFWQMGFGMNRLNNFNSNSLMQGINTENSKLDVYNEEANGVDYRLLEDTHGPYAFDLSPAWYVYLLDTIPGYTDQYYIPIDSGSALLQTQQIATKGSTNEFLISGGANFDDLLYIGASLGIPFTRYYRTSVFTESDYKNSIPYFDSWSYTEYLKTNAWGVNFKIGAILRPIDLLRIGLAFHTPTYYFSMKDSWSTDTYADYGVDSLFQQSPAGEYKYHLTTPMRIIGSLAFVIKKIGFISGEYEYVNYSQSKLKSKDFDFPVENSNIKNSFKSAMNFRVGTEWRISKIYLRAGYASYGSPYQNNLNDGARQYITGGIGYRADKFELDFAYSRATSNLDYYFYSTDNIQSNAVKNNFLIQQFALTFKYIIHKVK